MNDINDFAIKDSVLIEYTGDGGEVVIPDLNNFTHVIEKYNTKELN